VPFKHHLNIELYQLIVCQEDFYYFIPNVKFGEMDITFLLHGAGYSLKS